MAKCLHQLIGLTNVKKTKGKKVRKEVTALEQIIIGFDSTNICLGI